MSDKPPQTINLDRHLLQSAAMLDKTVDDVFPLLRLEAEPTHILRYKIAYQLMEQILVLAQSVIRLTKIAAEVRLFAVEENCHALLSLLRVLNEACNKFFYIAIHPQNDADMRFRWLIYTLVAHVKFRKIYLSVQGAQSDPAKDTKLAGIDAKIQGYKNELATRGIQNWPPFVALGNSHDGAARQQAVLDGATQTDYIRSDFDSAISSRLSPTEKQHYQSLGNVAVHSSAFMLFFRDEPAENGLGLLGSVTCLNVFNASRNIALCALEMIDTFPGMAPLIDAKTQTGFQAIVRDIKKPGYLFT